MCRGVVGELEDHDSLHLPTSRSVSSHCWPLKLISPTLSSFRDDYRVVPAFNRERKNSFNCAPRLISDTFGSLISNKSLGSSRPRVAALVINVLQINVVLLLEMVFRAIEKRVREV